MFKFKFDVAILGDNVVALDVVGRNWKGGIIAIDVARFYHQLIYVLCYCQQIGYRNIRVETDALGAVKCVAHNFAGSTYDGLILEDVKKLSLSFSISHVKKTDNIVVHLMTSVAPFSASECNFVRNFS